MNTDLIQGLNEEKKYTYRLLAQYQETLKEKENGKREGIPAICSHFTVVVLRRKSRENQPRGLHVVVRHPIMHKSTRIKNSILLILE